VRGGRAREPLPSAACLKEIQHLRIAAILPAYNEGKRVTEVAKVALRAPSVDEVIIVNDGSQDDTSAVARGLRGVRVVDLPRNVGKGGAMTAGAAATTADILIFLDADLIGLKPEHIERLVEPVKTRRYDMAVGSFRGGRRMTDWAQKITPNISGQRAIRRGTFEQIPDLENARYGVEMQITKFCQHHRVKTQVVMIPGVTHPMKEEKLGVLRGVMSRAKMYSQIVRIVLDPRKPRRVRIHRYGRPIPRLLRKFAANQRRQGRTDAAPYWLYRQERKWTKKREETRRRSHRRFGGWE
jgi:glycosyltransferase involved in cell wall biosynthesis